MSRPWRCATVSPAQQKRPFTSRTDRTQSPGLRMRAQHATRCCREAASSAGQSAHSADRSQVAISFYHYHFGLSLRHSPITVTSSIELQANTLRREWQRLTLCVLVSLGSVRRACGPVHTRRQISAPHTHTQTDAHTRTHPLPHRQHRGQTPPSYMCGSCTYASRRASGVPRVRRACGPPFACTRNTPRKRRANRTRNMRAHAPFRCATAQVASLEALNGHPCYYTTCE